VTSLPGSEREITPGVTVNAGGGLIMRESLALFAIRHDTTAQPRSTIFGETVSEYVEAMVRGDQPPPVTVFFDGQIRARRVGGRPETSGVPNHRTPNLRFVNTRRKE
jgi:hypothetical protein